MGLYIYNYFALFIQLLPKIQKRKEKRDVKRSKQSKEKSSQTKRPTKRSKSEGQRSVSSWRGNRSGTWQLCLFLQNCQILREETQAIHT